MWTSQQRNMEERNVGSLLGNSQDIIQRKQLAISSVNKLQAVWIRRNHIAEEKWPRLYNCLVLTILLYNCSTWGLTKKDENMLDLFHRSQLRYLIDKKIHKMQILSDIIIHSEGSLEVIWSYVEITSKVSR